MSERPAGGAGGTAAGRTGAGRTGRPERPANELIVTARDQLTPGMVRVRFRAADPAVFAESFGPSVFTDRYVKLVFPGPDGSSVVRTYTALEPDLEAATLAIDFVVHGTEGVAGPWAASAEPGATLTARGPGGAYAPDPSADWHLLAADEAGLPALRAALAALPDTARGHALVHVPADEHRQELPAPTGVEVQWLVSTADDALVEAVRALPWPSGKVDVFVHGEAQAVMHGIRPYLVGERGVERRGLSVSGYWRRGRTEEGFRAWKQELAASEG